MTDFTNMTREELIARYKENVAERKRLNEENPQVAFSIEMRCNSEAKIAALQAKLVALTAHVADPVGEDAPKVC